VTLKASDTCGAPDLALPTLVFRINWFPPRQEIEAVNGTPATLVKYGPAPAHIRSVVPNVFSAGLQGVYSWRPRSSECLFFAFLADDLSVLREQDVGMGAEEECLAFCINSTKVWGRERGRGWCLLFVVIRQGLGPVVTG